MPDVTFAHPGWGEALFIKDIYPTTRLVNYLEYFYRMDDGDVGFDPEFPVTVDDAPRIRIKNSTQLMSLVGCDASISPTHWQKSRYPQEYQHKIQVIHEGVDTDLLKPDPLASVDINGLRLEAGDEVVTYVARNLEPYRGFHTFMRALPALQAKRPNAHVLIVGAEGVSYGRRLPAGETYRQKYQSEVQAAVDWSRVHFLGQIQYERYIRVLQVSMAHVYLTYPFVLSWSMLEAMSAGCLIVGSSTPPVQEVITHGHDGLLTDFFDANALANTLADVLDKPKAFEGLRQQARETVMRRYDLKTVCLPAVMQYLLA